MLPAYFKGLRAMRPHANLHPAKRHIHPYSRVSYCGEAFTVMIICSKWLADQTEFIPATLKLHRDVSVPQRVILMGISEGAERQLCSRNIYSISHLVLLAHMVKHHHRFIGSWLSIQKTWGRPWQNPECRTESIAA